MSAREYLLARVTSWVIPLLLAVGTANAADFVSLQQAIQQGEGTIDLLETAHGRYDSHLVEPLEQLARVQLDAQRFDDADQTINRAIQIARISNGLYTAEQYPLLQLEIEISRIRGDWEAVAVQLEHFVLLVANRFEGERLTQLDRLHWIADKHLQCALESADAHRAEFLIKATTINEYAVQLAQVTGHTGDAVYGELLYGLSEKYYLETRGILGDKSSSYALRVLNYFDRAVEDKSTALQRRYLAGLEKLLMLRDNIAATPEHSSEALGMAELYIADWELLFDNAANSRGNYSRAIGLLRDAGIAEARIEEFFSQPVVIPRDTFTLSFGEALSGIEAARGVNALTLRETGAAVAVPGPVGQLSLREYTEHLPGVVAELADARLDSDLAGNWNQVELTLDFVPGTVSRFRSRGFSARNRAIPTAVDVVDSAVVHPAGEIRQVLARVKALPFRPALQKGELVPATLVVNYAYHTGNRSQTPQWVSLR